MDEETLLKFKEWLSKNMHMSVDVNMVIALIENIELKDEKIATLTADLEAARRLNKGYEAELADYGDTVTRLRNELAECKEKLQLDSLDFRGGE